MKTLNLIFLLVLLFSCSPKGKQSFYGIKGSGQVINYKRETSRFLTLILNQSANYVFVQDPYKNYFELDCDKDFTKYMVTQMRNDTCTFFFDEVVKYSSLNVNIRTSELRNIVINEDIELIINGPLKARSLSLIDNGSGKVNIDIATDTLKIFQNQNTDITFTGNANVLFIYSNGGNDINCSNLKSLHTFIVGNSSSEIKIGTTKYLDFDANANTKLYYQGEPIITQKNMSKGKLIKQ